MSARNSNPDHDAPTKSPPVGVAFLVSQVGTHAALRFAERLSALNLKPHDAGILRMLGSNSGITQQALSALLGMFPSQLVALLDALENRSLIERRNTPSDRRSYRLYLTKPGRKTLAEIGRLTLQLEDDLFAALSEREKKILLEFLTRIVVQQGVTPGVHPAYRQIGRR
jgi:DNA-binding MarR family transcriptional regulator